MALAAGDVSHLFKKGGRPQHAPPSGGHHQQSHGEGGILRLHNDVSPEGNYQFGWVYGAFWEIVNTV